MSNVIGNRLHRLVQYVDRGRSTYVVEMLSDRDEVVAVTLADLWSNAACRRALMLAAMHHAPDLRMPTVYSLRDWREYVMPLLNRHGWVRVEAPPPPRTTTARRSTPRRRVGAR